MISPDKASRLQKAEQMIREVNNLPTIPEITTRVSHLLDDPDVELDQVAEVILTDQAYINKHREELKAKYREMFELK